MSFDFTTKMQFPDDFVQLVKDSQEDAIKLIEIIMLNGETEEIDQNLKTWTIDSVSSSRIKISLEFENPTHVS